MKTFINRIISFVFLCVSGLNTMLDAAQWPPASGISSSMSSSWGTALQPMDVNVTPTAKQHKRKKKEAASDSEASEESATSRRRINPERDLRIGQRNMIIICDGGSCARSSSSDSDSELGAFVTAIVQKPAACILVHEGLWDMFLTHSFDSAMTNILLFDDAFWEMYKVPVPNNTQCFYLFIPRLYKELVGGTSQETLARSIDHMNLIQGSSTRKECLERFEAEIKSMDRRLDEFQAKKIQISCLKSEIRSKKLEALKKLDECAVCVGAHNTSKSIDLLRNTDFAGINLADLLFGLKISCLQPVANPLMMHGRLSECIQAGQASQLLDYFENAEKAFQNLPQILESLFITRNDIDLVVQKNLSTDHCNSPINYDVMNTWNIYMSGHGSKTTFNKSFITKLEALKQKLPIKTGSDLEAFKSQRKQLFADSEGYIANLPIDVFADTLDFFNTSVKTNFMYLSSCYAAGEHLVLLNMIAPQKRSFILAIGTAVFESTSSNFGISCANIPLGPPLAWCRSILDQHILKSSTNFNMFFLGLNNPENFRKMSLPDERVKPRDYFTRVTNFANKFMHDGSVVANERIPHLSFGTEWFSVTSLGEQAIEITNSLVRAAQIKSIPSLTKFFTQNGIKVSDPSKSAIDLCGKKLAWILTPKITVSIICEEELCAIMPLVNTATFAQIKTDDFLLPKMIFFKEIIVQEKPVEPMAALPRQITQENVADFIVQRVALKMFVEEAVVRPTNTVILIKKLTRGCTSINNICLVIKAYDPIDNLHRDLAVRYVDDQGKTQLITYTLDPDRKIETKSAEDTSRQLDKAAYESIYNKLCLKVLGDDDFPHITQRAPSGLSRLKEYCAIQ